MKEKIKCLYILPAVSYLFIGPLNITNRINLSQNTV